MFISLHGTIAVASIFERFGSFNRNSERNLRLYTAKIEALNRGNTIDVSKSYGTVDAAVDKNTLYASHDKDSVAPGNK